MLVARVGVEDIVDLGLSKLEVYFTITPAVGR
jgi:hypothetical protein